MLKGSNNLIEWCILMILFVQNPNALDFFLSAQYDSHKSHWFFLVDTAIQAVLWWCISVRKAHKQGLVDYPASFKDTKYLNNTTASAMPAKGAVRYSHVGSQWFPTSAGPNERAGFMEALVRGPANMASSKITLPTAKPDTGPISLLPVLIWRMTIIRKKDNRNSSQKALSCGMLGMVAPIITLFGIIAFTATLAATAAAVWVIT